MSRRRVSRNWLELAAFVAAMGLGAAPVRGLERAENAVFVVIDGIRFQESFGAKSRHMPVFWNRMRPQGTLFNRCRNDGRTMTVSGHATLLTGRWQFLPNDGWIRPQAPTIFEYFQKQRGTDPRSVWLVAHKVFLWRADHSAAPGYGARWGASHLIKGDDAWVRDSALRVLQRDHPRVLYVVFGETDHEAHEGSLRRYADALQRADGYAGQIWSFLRQDPFYKDKTLFVLTTDHGRHDADFRDHGDDCEGCRRVPLFMSGPGIRRGFVSDEPCTLADVLPTVAAGMGLSVPLAEGRVLAEILEEVPAGKDVPDIPPAEAEMGRLLSVPMARKAAQRCWEEFIVKSAPGGGEDRGFLLTALWGAANRYGWNDLLQNIRAWVADRTRNQMDKEAFLKEDPFAWRLLCDVQGADPGSPSPASLVEGFPEWEKAHASVAAGFSPRREAARLWGVSAGEAGWARIQGDPACFDRAAARAAGDADDVGPARPFQWGDRSYPWLTGNACRFMALLDLYEAVPADRLKEREVLGRDIRRLAEFFLETQKDDGLWPEDLADPRSRTDEAGSALVVAALARALRSGLVPRQGADRAAAAARALRFWMGADGLPLGGFQDSVADVAAVHGIPSYAGGRLSDAWSAACLLWALGEGEDLARSLPTRVKPVLN